MPVTSTIKSYTTYSSKSSRYCNCIPESIITGPLSVGKDILHLFSKELLRRCYIVTSVWDTAHFTHGTHYCEIGSAPRVALSGQDLMAENYGYHR